jgi:arginase
MKLAVLGVPSSIGARNPGTEKAPGALRSAGLLERLHALGHDVEDRGDQEAVPFFPDPDPARSKHQNLPGVLAMAKTLAARVESALRDGRKLLVLGGDCTVALGSLAGISRVHPDAGLAYLDRDAELNTPQSSRSGILDGMVIAHLLGRGAPALWRMEDRSPLLRPGRLALLGIERLDPQEIPVFDALPSLRLQPLELRRRGVEASARDTLSRIASGAAPFYVHFDVDVVDGTEISAVDFPAPGGLGVEEVRGLLAEMAADSRFLGMEVTNFNPDRDLGGAGAERLVRLISGSLGSVRAEP